MPSVSCCSLEHGLPTIHLNISSGQSLLKLRFVHFHIFLAYRNPGDSPSDHGDKQVIAPFLIVLRVANRTAVTSDVVYGDIGSICIIQEESVEGGEAPPGGNHANSATGEKTARELCSASEVTTVDLPHEKT